MASGAHAILIPEIPFRLEPVAATIDQRERARRQVLDRRRRRGRACRSAARCRCIGKPIGQAEQLGGIGAKVAAELERLTGKEARTVVLGHLLRGGSPTSFDRLLGLRFGAAAVRGAGGGPRRRDGGAQPADRRLRPARRGDQPA